LSSLSFITAVYPVILSEKKSDKICLMAHFDPLGRIEPYVLYYIKALFEEGFDVVLVSTSETLDDADRKSALVYCRSIIQRKNIGLDFASWKTAFDFIPDIQTYKRILLANDSVFGPFTSLREVFKKFEESLAQVCGLIDCHQIDYHLQSYFLYLKSEVFDNRAFIDFWKNIRIKHVKMEIVREYEVGFSRKLHSAGVELYALYKYDEILKYVKEYIPEFQYMPDLEKHPLNSSLHMWDILLKNYNYPFIKTVIWNVS
jgi:rhamnosyltransferase